ncbi:metallophosphoesterase, partial [Anaerotignum faecicola]|nr:metallophosphoesterase [Anaerotignum faecicola]
LNVSGHVHIQHIAENGGLYDIATGSLTVAPNRYGVLTVGSDGSTSYETRKVHVGRWDREKSGIAGDFENFEELSQAYFDECTRKKMKKELEALSVSEEERAQMTELAVEMNRNYFAGMTKPEKEIADTPGWKLWKEKGAELFFGSYMDSMME